MTFRNFTRLSQELRDLIWAEAAAIQCQYIVDSQPEPCTTPHAERQRQALVGYDNLPSSTERQRLRIYIHTSGQMDELCLGENEFQTLVNRLPMATCCSEARANAIKFCHAQTKFLNLFRVVENQLPDEKPILEPIFTDMTTVMVTTSRFHPQDGPEGFDSPDQVVDVIARVFGSGVKTIIWSAWCQSGFAMSDIYWPHSPRLGQIEDNEFGMIDRSGHSEPTHYMSQDSVLHIEPELYKTEVPNGETFYDLRLMYRHTPKVSELLGAAEKLLPQLRHVQVELRTYCWGKISITELETTFRDNVIWIGRHNLNIAIFHYFSRTY
ncbi:hypothetical protein M3J07_009196 [Ascochyta lentis]